jgi:hypothetical protein
MLAHTSYKLIRSILRDHEIATKVFDKLAKRYLQLQMCMSFYFVMLMTEGGLSALHICISYVDFPMIQLKQNWALETQQTHLVQVLYAYDPRIPLMK